MNAIGYKTKITKYQLISSVCSQLLDKPFLENLLLTTNHADTIMYHACLLSVSNCKYLFIALRNNSIQLHSLRISYS